MIPTRSNRGFTLLEVLVALAIIGLGMIGIFAQMNQTLIATALIRDKTFAQWVALDRITELRLQGEFPGVGERSDSVEMAGTEWAYTIKVSEVGIENFRRLDVRVAHADKPDRSIITVTGFISQPSSERPAAPGTWVPLDPNAELGQ